MKILLALILFIAAQEELLAPDSVFERRLAAAGKDIYELPTADRSFLSISVEQKGIDIGLRLTSQDSKVLKEVNRSAGTRGTETLRSIVAAGARLEVVAVSPLAKSGSYSLKVLALSRPNAKQEAEIAIDEMVEKAGVLRRANRVDEAIKTLEEALSRAVEVLGEEDLTSAECQNNLAMLYKDKGDYKRAEPLYRRALATREKILGADSPIVADSLNNLAIELQSTGDLDEAERLHKRALSIRKKAFGQENTDVAASLNNLGWIERQRGNYSLAEPLYRQSLEIFEQLLGREHADVAIAVNNLANLYWVKGDYNSAEPLYKRALAIREKALGSEHQSVATSLNNLALLYHDKGDYVRAEPLYQRALTIREKLSSESPAVAIGLNNLAALYRERGDYASAEPLYKRALAIREKTLGSEHNFVAVSLNNLANLYIDKEDYANAEQLFKRALELWRKNLGADHPDVARGLHNLASVYYAQKEYRKAEPLYLQALEIWQKRHGTDHPDTALCLNSLAKLYQEDGDYKRAKPLYLQALDIRRRVYGEQDKHVAESLSQLAKLAIYQKDYAEALRQQTLANEISERDLMRNLMVGSERQKFLYLQQTRSMLDITISLQAVALAQDAQALKAALTIALQRKGRALDAMASSIEVLRRRATARDRSMLERLIELRQQLSRLSLQGRGKRTEQEYKAELERLESAAEEAEREISQRSQEFQIQQTPITLEGVQRRISASSVLVEYLNYTRSDFQSGEQHRHYIAYTLNREGEVRSIDLGSSEAIDELARKLRSALRNQRETARLGRELDKLVMEPVRRLVGSKRHLLIAPDGELNLIPFAALRDEQGRYLIKRYTLTYLTSGRDLLRLRVKIPSAEPPLVLADPDYTTGPGPKLYGMEVRQLQRLSGTKQEALTIQQQFQNSRVLTRELATKERLERAIRPEILHIATHGFFMQNAPLPTDRGTRNLAWADSEVNLEQVRRDHPLMRSFLFFAGANSSEDGTMTAAEVAGLNLWGTRLVVLSACDTGVGDIKNGEGVYGLRRALVLAGSESQMMSLWPISDRATQELMTLYYKLLKTGKGRSEALRLVQLRMLKDPKRRHPFYWASFIQSGKWQPLFQAR